MTIKMQFTKIRMDRIISLIFLTTLGMSLTACQKIEDINVHVVEIVSKATHLPEQQHGDKLAKTFHQYWAVKTGSRLPDLELAIAPVIMGDSIITADSKGHVRSRNLTTGKLSWVSDIDIPVSSGPSIDGDLITLGGPDGKVTALDSKTGKQRWFSHLTSEILSAPTMTDSGVYVKTFDDCIYKLERSTGKQVWSYCHDPVQFKLRASSGVAVGSGLVVAGFPDGNLIAFDENSGARRWSTRIATPSGDTQIQRLVDVDATPVILDGIIYVVSYQGALASLSLDTGQVLWTKNVGAYRGLAFDQENLYLTDNKNTLWAFALDSGLVKWQQKDFANRTITAPSVYKNHLIVADSAGYLMGLSLKSGKLVGQSLFDKSGVDAQVLINKNRIYVQSRNGLLASYSFIREA